MTVHSDEVVLPVSVVDVDSCGVVSTVCCGTEDEHIGEVVSVDDTTDCMGVVGGEDDL